MYIVYTHMCECSYGTVRLYWYLYLVSLRVWIMDRLIVTFYSLPLYLIKRECPIIVVSDSLNN